jgi:hypothetical protein
MAAARDDQNPSIFTIDVGELGNGRLFNFVNSSFVLPLPLRDSNRLIFLNTARNKFNFKYLDHAG